MAFTLTFLNNSLYVYKKKTENKNEVKKSKE